MTTQSLRILGLCTALLFAPRSFAQETEAADIAGRWSGAISAMGQVLEIQLSFERAGDAWSGSLSIPIQSLHDAPLADVELEGSSITFGLPGVPGNARFEGELSDDGKRLEGPFVQHGLRMSWHATRDTAATDDAAERLADFGDWLESARVAWDVPGIAVVCVRGGEVVSIEARGMRDVEQALPVTPDTLFAIGSSTKAFTALGLGSFVEEGHVSWDDPVRDVLPEFRLHTSLDSDAVTLRDLVTHRTGLPRHDAVWYGHSSMERRGLLERLPHLEPTARLRETWQYNNLMFVVAGIVIEELAGESWEDALRARLLTPLGMNRTVFSVTDAQEDADHALPYRIDDNKPVRIPYRRIENVGPAGSIQSSVRDMAQWLKLWLGNGEVDGKRVAKEATLAEQRTPAMLMLGFDLEQDVMPIGYGHGWMIDLYRGHVRVHHGGAIDGFTAMVAFVPKEAVGVVVFANTNSGLPGIAAQHALDRLLGLESKDWSGLALATRDAAKALADTQAEGGDDSAPPRRADASPPRPLDEYVGIYEHKGYGRVVIELDGDALKLTSEDLSSRLEPWHFEVFRFAKEEGSMLSGQLVRFECDFDGEVAALSSRAEVMLEPLRFARLPDERLTDPAYLARYVGRYSLGGVIVRVELRGETLTTTVPGQPTYDLEPRRLGEFELANLSGFRLRFEPTGDAPVETAVFVQPNGTFRAKRVAD